MNTIEFGKPYNIILADTKNSIYYNNYIRYQNIAFKEMLKKLIKNKSFIYVNDYESIIDETVNRIKISDIFNITFIRKKVNLLLEKVRNDKTMLRMLSNSIGEKIMLI